jgi:uncharacterized membrane protein YbhN (UPF0104 family)
MKRDTSFSFLIYMYKRKKCSEVVQLVLQWFISIGFIVILLLVIAFIFFFLKKNLPHTESKTIDPYEEHDFPTDDSKDL